LKLSQQCRIAKLEKGKEESRGRKKQRKEGKEEEGNLEKGE
jgi:hypothetical protein